MKDEHAQQLADMLTKYDRAQPEATADKLRNLWFQYEPKSIEVIKAKLRQQKETTGIPVPVLRSIGDEISRAALHHVAACEGGPILRSQWAPAHRFEIAQSWDAT